MTVNPRVNPKKLRPYDEPPKRRRGLLPSAPDGAATWFIVAAVAWFVMATGLGVLAADLRFMPFELSFPFGVFDLGFTLNGARVEQAFTNALVYGWLSNAGFAAVAFMTPRLVGRRQAGESSAFFALLVWNLSVLGGIASLYVFDPGLHSALTAFPWLIDGGMALGALIMTGVFFATAGTAILSGYVSLWFMGIGLLSIVGLLGLNAGLDLLDFVTDVQPLALALGSLFIERATALLWLLPMAYATLLYVVPRTVDRPLESSGVAVLAWFAWFVTAPIASLSNVVDTSIPFFVTSMASAATMLLLLPVALVIANLVQTARGRWTLLFGTGPAALAAVALAFLLGASMIDAVGALRSVRAWIGDTDWAAGVSIWMLLGAFTMAAVAFVEHALPRVLRRDWGRNPFSVVQLWTIFAGTTIAGIALIGAGMAEGSFRAQGADADAIAAGLLGYQLVAFAGIGLVALGALAALGNLFMAYTTGEPADYVVPAKPATALGGR